MAIKIRGGKALMALVDELFCGLPYYIVIYFCIYFWTPAYTPPLKVLTTVPNIFFFSISISLCYMEIAGYRP